MIKETLDFNAGGAGDKRRACRTRGGERAISPQKRSRVSETVSKFLATLQAEER